MPKSNDINFIFFEAQATKDYIESIHNTKPAGFKYKYINPKEYIVENLEDKEPVEDGINITVVNLDELKEKRATIDSNREEFLEAFFVDPEYSDFPAEQIKEEHKPLMKAVTTIMDAEVGSGGVDGVNFTFVEEGEYKGVTSQLNKLFETNAKKWGDISVAVEKSRGTLPKVGEKNNPFDKVSFLLKFSTNALKNGFLKGTKVPKALIRAKYESLITNPALKLKAGSESFIKDLTNVMDRATKKTPKLKPLDAIEQENFKLPSPLDKNKFDTKQ